MTTAELTRRKKRPAIMKFERKSQTELRKERSDPAVLPDQPINPRAARRPLIWITIFSVITRFWFLSHPDQVVYAFDLIVGLMRSTSSNSHQTT